MYAPTGCEKVDTLLARATAGGLDVSVKESDGFFSAIVKRHQKEMSTWLDFVDQQETLMLHWHKSTVTNRWVARAQYLSGGLKSHYEYTPMKMVKYHLDFLLERA